MTLAFIFDTKLLKIDDNYYAINLNYNLWKNRYLPIFDNIIVSTRVLETSIDTINNNRGYVLSNGTNVTMKPVTQYNNILDIILRRKKIKEQLNDVIDSADCVIIRLPSVLGSYACSICRKKKKKYAIEMVACPWDGYCHHGHWAGKFIAPIMYFITRKNCIEAKRVLYVTKQFLQSRYPTNGKNINASNVMIDKPDSYILNNRLKKIEDKSDYNFILGLVGNLNLESKGHLIALKAIKILKEKYPNIKIQFLGFGDKTYLEKMANKLKITDNIEFLGTLPGGNPVLKWMDTLDLLVIPSFQEGLPRVLIEAMSRGCPAVGTRAGGIPELINESLICKPGDFKQLARNIDKILSNKKLQKQLAKDNFACSLEYTKDILDTRRNKFWTEFKNEKI